MLCSTDSPGVLPCAWVWTQGLGTAGLDSSLEDTLIKCSVLYDVLLEYKGPFPTDREEDFLAQLTRCLPEVCDMAFSSPVLL